MWEGGERKYCQKATKTLILFNLSWKFNKYMYNQGFHFCVLGTIQHTNMGSIAV
jgi:hypothetical protein